MRVGVPHSAPWAFDLCFVLQGDDVYAHVDDRDRGRLDDGVDDDVGARDGARHSPDPQRFCAPEARASTSTMTPALDTKIENMFRPRSQIQPRSSLKYSGSPHVKRTMKGAGPTMLKRASFAAVNLQPCTPSPPSVGGSSGRLPAALSCLVDKAGSEGHGGRRYGIVVCRAQQRRSTIVMLVGA
ncbi:hypothetical protein EJ03DRAFT_148985 [Teratosphaeria nubilosa]|uniref:Uncharacterized protein n=1 Tax=Teratosphaeria nubilosa TaxID=161662 RepID=A0A6G1L4F7_9PEZI|nr:hypothetical protein EJ03DRAFT_148985 [Teratosphaeria nubilosa]